MDIYVYENIKEGMKRYFDTLSLTKSFKPAILGFEPTNPVPPYIIVTERQVPMQGFSGSMETVASMSYTFDIYAKTSGSNTKQFIARKIASYVDEFARFYVGLRQMSWNDFPRDGKDGELYRVSITYTGQYFEQRLKFL